MFRHRPGSTLVQWSWRCGSIAIAAGVLALTAGCVHSPVPTSTARSASSAQLRLLVRLKQCRAALAASPNDNVVSPCSRKSVERLSGMPKSELEAYLGTPDISSDDYVVGVAGGRVAHVKPYECRWGFYNLPANTLGGGPELMCTSADRVKCDRVRWVQTQ